MNKSWGGSRTNDVITNECIHRIADTHGQSQKDGLSIPAQEEYPGEGDSQDDTRGRRVVERADKVKNEEDPWPVGQALNSSAECQFDRPGAWMVMHKHGSHSERKQANHPGRDGNASVDSAIPPMWRAHLPRMFLHMCFRQHRWTMHTFIPLLSVTPQVPQARGRGCHLAHDDEPVYLLSCDVGR